MQNRKPVYLLAGGRPGGPGSMDTILGTVFKESGVRSPAIAYSGTANGDDKGFFRRIADQFTAAGAGRVTHAVIGSPDADLARARQILSVADIVFISGGDVDSGMRVLVEKNMTGFLEDLYRQGKPFFGISAGAIMLAEQWVRWYNPDDSAAFELFSCLGFAPVICDCHDEEGGWEELKAALSLAGISRVGYGLVSGSAISVTPEGTVQALGRPVHRYIRNQEGIARMADLLPETVR